jgi:hypothetical protein
MRTRRKSYLTVIDRAPEHIARTRRSFLKAMRDPAKHQTAQLEKAPISCDAAHVIAALHVDLQPELFRIKLI